MYDTVTTVGHRDETNPLLIYRGGTFHLLDHSTLVYSEPGITGRLVVVDPLTGEGWQVASARGEDGPGEFGGSQPLPTPFDGVIHTITGQMYNAFSAEGDLLSSERFGVPVITLGAEGRNLPVGFVGDRVVTTFLGAPESRSGEVVSDQMIRVLDITEGVVAEVRGGVAPLVQRPVARGGIEGFEVVSGSLSVAARGNTIAWGYFNERTLATTDGSGELLASRTLDYPVSSILIDASERVWAKVRAQDPDGVLGNIVFDRELNELFRVAAQGVTDASDDVMLTFRTEPDTGLKLLTLLRLRD